MGMKNLFRSAQPQVAVQTARQSGGLVSPLLALQQPDYALYDAMRAAVPIVDAALLKIVRLVGGFELMCENPAAQRRLRQFAEGVQVGAGCQGLAAFVSRYLESLLTYGNAVGEMVLTPAGDSIAALYNAPLQQLEIRPGENPLQCQIYLRRLGESLPLPRPQLVLFTPLNPPAGEVLGKSLLRGLPSVCGILLKIYESIGNNFERIANLRYAVTYRPQAEADRHNAREIAGAIAKEWSQVMSPGPGGQIRDFVAVGDVDIRVIGADNQTLDTSVPVRQMLEEIVAKLGLPPFLLGLNWSSTERMSRQQADLLTSELEAYRSLLTPVVLRVCNTLLRLEGYDCTASLSWNHITLLDETELANARLAAARAARLEAGRPTTQEEGGTAT